MPTPVGCFGPAAGGEGKLPLPTLARRPLAARFVVVHGVGVPGAATDVPAHRLGRVGHICSDLLGGVGGVPCHVLRRCRGLGLRSAAVFAAPSVTLFAAVSAAPPSVRASAALVAAPPSLTASCARPRSAASF